MRSKTKHYTVKVKKVYYYDPKKPSPVPSLPRVDLPPEDCCSSDPVKEGEDPGLRNMAFLPSRAFSVEVENLSFRKVQGVPQKTLQGYIIKVKSLECFFLGHHVVAVHYFNPEDFNFYFQHNILNNPNNSTESSRNTLKKVIQS